MLRRFTAKSCASTERTPGPCIAKPGPRFARRISLSQCLVLVKIPHNPMALKFYSDDPGIGHFKWTARARG